MGANEKVAATFHGGDESGGQYPDAITSLVGASRALSKAFRERDEARLERDALQDALIRVLDALPSCSQCGQPFRARACGPTHAVVAEDPASHRIFKEESAYREEWTVRHSQGTHPGPFTERQAREWIEVNRLRDSRRQFGVRGQQRLLRRYVTEWEEVPS